MGYNHDSVTTESIVQENYQTVRQSIASDIYNTAIATDQNIKSEDYFTDFDLLSMNTFHGKRAIDLVLGIFALITFAVLYPIFGLFIKLSSRGPILYKQKRTGQKGQEFTCYKFRTMHQLNLRRIDGKPVVTQKGDKRIFWFGSFLRCTNLDELPQVINVLKGDMSVVGPRPEVRKWTEVYPERWRNVLLVKPGITDKASLKYNNEEQVLSGADDPENYYKERILPDKLKLYEEYLTNSCMYYDLGILFRTFGSLFIRRN